ncbi:hypothetical protein U14_04105 [Candidatus Moduliflexus flocculans]|uniref:Uncharacterized protein n=1 Tax=Candidatus Moduliflexus flocculans TaxID=1499966 RepID=A0A0S6W012_9BACT|nr:hypothetical protein U14_04105 [Candidatus Moduliflexus flocculans]
MKRHKFALMLLLIFFSAAPGFAQTDNLSPPQSNVTFEDWKLPEEYEQELLIWFAMLAFALLFAVGLYLAQQHQLSPEAAAQLLQQLQPERERLERDVAQAERRVSQEQQLKELNRLCNRLSSNSVR